MPNLALYDQNLGSNVVKIDPESMSVLETYDVGLGPESLLILNDGMSLEKTIVLIGIRLIMDHLRYLMAVLRL